jgi:hypothetical protein
MFGWSAGSDHSVCIREHVPLGCFRCACPGEAVPCTRLCVVIMICKIGLLWLALVRLLQPLCECAWLGLFLGLRLGHVLTPC